MDFLIIITVHQGFGTASSNNQYLLVSCQCLFFDSWCSFIPTETTATGWDIYDSHIQSETTKSETENDPHSTLSTSNIQENVQENSSSRSGSSICTGNSTWLLPLDWRDHAIAFFIKASDAIMGMYHFLIFHFFRQYHQLTIRNRQLLEESKCWAQPSRNLGVRVFPVQFVSHDEEHHD